MMDEVVASSTKKITTFSKLVVGEGFRELRLPGAIRVGPTVPVPVPVPRTPRSHDTTPEGIRWATAHVTSKTLFCSTVENVR